MSLTVEKIRESFGQAGLTDYFTPEALKGLLKFSHKMLQINETLNLTRWIEDEAFLNFHLLDSAFSLPHLKPFLKDSHHWMDLGTGCGFPGAVLMASNPQVEITLMDSVAKKTKALEECLNESGLRGKTLTGRAEELGQDPRQRESWDGITARAVADFRVVLEYAVPLLKVGGYLVNWMTADQLKLVDKAETAQKLLHCKIIKKAEYQSNKPMTALLDLIKSYNETSN